MLRVLCDYPEVASLEDWLLTIQRTVLEFKPNRVALDSLSALERIGTMKAFREFVIGFTSFIKQQEIAGLFTSTTPSLMGGTSITEDKTLNLTWYDGDRRPLDEIQSLAAPGSLPAQGSIFVGTKGAMLLPHIENPVLLPAAQFAGYVMPQAESDNHYHQFVDAVLNQGLPAPIDLQVSSQSLESAYEIATSLARRIRNLPGVSDVYIPQDIDYPALQLQVDRVRVRAGAPAAQAVDRRAPHDGGGHGTRPEEPPTPGRKRALVAR